MNKSFPIVKPNESCECMVRNAGVHVLTEKVKPPGLLFPDKTSHVIRITQEFRFHFITILNSWKLEIIDRSHTGSEKMNPYHRTEHRFYASFLF